MGSYSSELTDEVATLRIATRMAETGRRARKHSMKAVNTCLLFCSILAAFVGLGYIFFDPLVKHVVLNRLVMTNTSEMAKIWQNPPIKPHFKVWFFNFTNPAEFFSGAEKPVLEEVGPYVYSQKWTKGNIKWFPNGTMSYETLKKFTFERSESVGDHRSDSIVTLNVPAISAYYQMRDAGWLSSFFVEQAVLGLGYDPWVRRTPEELIWGYDEPLFDLAKLMPNAPAIEKFGLFPDKNATENLSSYTMFTGEGDPYKLSEISKFNGQEKLSFWEEDEHQCNIIKGSDGATFNPYIRETDTLWFFNDQLCRSLPLVFDRRVDFDALPGYRFVPRSDVFMSPDSVSSNGCFCTEKNAKLCSMIGDGMFAVSQCQYDAPVVLSWPHFMGTEPRYREAVVGMRPDPAKHGFWFDIQPTTGTTLSAKARLQVNMAVPRIDSFKHLAKVNDTIVPLVWFEEGLDGLGPDLMKTLEEAVLAPPVYKNYILCVLLGLAFLTVLIACIAAVRLCLNRRRCCCGDDDDDDMEPGTAAVARIESIAHHILAKDQSGSSSAAAAAADPAAAQPFLPLSSAESSTDSSRLSSAITSASHSRNSSTGSNFAASSENGGGAAAANAAAAAAATSIVDCPEADKLTSLLDPITKLPNV